MTHGWGRKNVPAKPDKWHFSTVCLPEKPITRQPLA
jgi:hypothetical protein